MEEEVRNDETPVAIDLEETPPGHKSGFVAVIGRPNVGKSTLMNQLLGQKVAIVSPKPQTTRTRIQGILTRPDAQIIFVDTPGLHRPLHKLGEAMVATAASAIPDADVILFVVDVSVMPTDEDRMIAEMIRQRTTKPVILVLNKMDLLPPENVKPHTEAYWDLVPQRADWMMTIATEGVNLDKLLNQIVRHLPEGPRYYPGDLITDQTEREIAAELIREQVLHFTYEEVPHSVAVVVEEYKEREGGGVYIAATIYVEKESQKGILIGAGGQMLRRIGTAARQEIERMVGGKVYLDLWVKVSKNWRKNPAMVRRLGYGR
ncbi:MAG: GTPase Era [Anaerolineae bacterium]|nr:GTPase Era [Anaerolineae bacterium]MCX8066540.1 GTPase Era [Anaerolineae bacterium]